jgi:hypothetical protein
MSAGSRKHCIEARNEGKAVGFGSTADFTIADTQVDLITIHSPRQAALIFDVLRG